MATPAKPDLSQSIYANKVLSGPMVPGWLNTETAALFHDLDPRIAKESIIAPEKTLRALSFFPIHRTKVIILGQDPYPQPGKATGLCFGVNSEWARTTNYVPDSSIANIAKEMATDVSETLTNLSLEHWARQGVLMLNTRLSVAEGAPMSHAGLGWEKITGTILERATFLTDKPVVVIAWGAEARRFAERNVVEGRGHVIITSAHPCRKSASRGFFGSRPFSATNALLKERDHAPISWGG